MHIASPSYSFTGTSSMEIIMVNDYKDVRCGTVNTNEIFKKDLNAQ